MFQLKNLCFLMIAKGWSVLLRGLYKRTKSKIPSYICKIAVMAIVTYNLSNMEQQTKPPLVNSFIIQGAGILSAIFSILFILITYSEGLQGKDFWIDLLGAVLAGLIAFVCLSKWKRANALIMSIILLGAAIWMTTYLVNDTVDDYWTTLIWAVGFYIAGLSNLLRFFNTSISLFLKKIPQTKTFRLIVKVVFWSALIGIGMLLFTGIFSFLAGLSATTIIIILLFLILMK